MRGSRLASYSLAPSNTNEDVLWHDRKKRSRRVDELLFCTANPSLLSVYKKVRVIPVGGFAFQAANA